MGLKNQPEASWTQSGPGQSMLLVFYGKEQQTCYLYVQARDLAKQALRSLVCFAIWPENQDKPQPNDQKTQLP